MLFKSLNLKKNDRILRAAIAATEIIKLRTHFDCVNSERFHCLSKSHPSLSTLAPVAPHTLASSRSVLQSYQPLITSLDFPA